MSIIIKFLVSYSNVNKIDSLNLSQQNNFFSTIAHLDHDELNHSVSLERLAALCQLCHLRYDAKEKYRRVMNKQLNLQLQ